MLQDEMYEYAMNVEICERRNILSDNKQRKKLAKFPEMVIALIIWNKQESKAG